MPAIQFKTGEAASHNVGRGLVRYLSNFFGHCQTLVEYPSCDRLASWYKSSRSLLTVLFHSSDLPLRWQMCKDYRPRSSLPAPGGRYWQHSFQTRLSLTSNMCRSRKTTLHQITADPILFHSRPGQKLQINSQVEVGMCTLIPNVSP